MQLGLFPLGVTAQDLRVARRTLRRCQRELRRLLEETEDLEDIPTTRVYDAGSNALGLCVACGAWPGQAHMLDEGAGECDTSRGLRFLGRGTYGREPVTEDLVDLLLVPLGQVFLDLAEHVEVVQVSSSTCLEVLKPSKIHDAMMRVGELGRHALEEASAARERGLAEQRAMGRRLRVARARLLGALLGAAAALPRVLALRTEVAL